MNSLLPTRKVGAGSLAGALSILILWGLKTYGNVELGAEGGGAVTTVLTFITSYFVTEP